MIPSSAGSRRSPSPARRWHFAGTAPTAAAATIVVTPATATWSLIVETPTASGTFVTGPATPPAGTGSLQLVNGASGGGILFSTLSHSGRRLDDIAALGYGAYVVSAASPSITASLQLDVDYDVTDGTTTWQGRLVYDPGSSGGTVPAATWIDYDTQAGPPRWWSTGTPIVGNTPLAKACSQASPCTWAQVLANYPNAAIRPLVGGFGVKLGNAGAAATVAVDRVVIAGTIYDFELAGTPPVSNCGGFSDVTTSDIYCGAVEWLKSRAVTLGCTATTYCPNDVVTRASMALFLNRLGTTLSPLPTLTQQQTAALPVVPFAVICQTAPTGANLCATPRSHNGRSTCSTAPAVCCRRSIRCSSVDAGCTGSSTPTGPPSTAAPGSGATSQGPRTPTSAPGSPRVSGSG